MFKKKLESFSVLLKEFLKINDDLEAVIVSDADGLMIGGETRKDVDMELISFLTAVINPTIDRIRNEFSFREYGTANFDTENHRLLFVSVNKNTTLSLVMDVMAQIDNITPYAYFLAEKVAQILSEDEIEYFKLTLPDFEVHGSYLQQRERIKEQIYDDSIKSGATYAFKFIIIGDHRVGKTSLVRQFVEERFSKDYRATIGLNIIAHEFEAFNNTINLNLWDIGAQKYFKRFRKTYYKGAQAAFIVFDLSDRESFDNVKQWHNELRDFIENKDLPIVIVGNKKDLGEQRVVNKEEAMALAKELSSISEFYAPSDLSEYSDLSNVSEEAQSRISYIETSALTGENVEDAFKLLSYHFIRRYQQLVEEEYKNEIRRNIDSILKYQDNLVLNFVSEDPMWSPAFQIMNEIKTGETPEKLKDKKEAKIFSFSNGLIIKNFSFDSVTLNEDDGVFFILDARKEGHINQKSNDMLKDVIKKLKKNKVISIGVRISDKVNWSELMKEFEISSLAEKEEISVLFFKVGKDYKMDILNKLNVFVDTIENLQFNY